MTRLSMEQITRKNENRDVGSVTSLQLSYRALSDVSHMFSHIRITLLVKVSCLSNYQNLEKLDLSYNCLTSLEGLSACVNLKWLQVFENKLATLKGVESLSKLTVLNAGRNKLEKMDEIYGLKNLRALILNDNNISSICKLGQMKYLNTLGMALPEELSKNIRLRTLDIGNNQIEKLHEIKVLSSLHNLKSLNLLGNPIAENDKLLKKTQIMCQVRRFVPNVQIFNAKRTESSSSSLKVSEKPSSHPSKADSSLEISSGVEDIKKRKKGDFKREDTIADIEFDGKNKSLDSGADVSGNASKVTTKKKKENSGYMEENISPKAEQKPKSKSSVVGEDGMLMDIDDPTRPFTDLIFSGKTVDDSEREEGRETRHDARFDGIVIEHRKNLEKRSKNRDSGLSAMFFSKHEIGMGGLSTWDT
ncbi:hypothetical protein KSP39_PZI011497 [Platanthera zijinensis]|uniref:Protein phosphatase 1 regulatory subunit 7 n=1 Tax=Platanthera zijinensis TaxID=2320716 RepID=A0AAP0G5K4_9ASPA